MLKLLKKMKICQKCFGVHFLQLFAANTRSFQVKKLSSIGYNFRGGKVQLNQFQ